MRRFEDRRVIVTGAGRGIGAATARAFAAEGAQVLLVSRTRSELDAVAAGIEAGGGRAAVHVADVGEPDGAASIAAAAVARLGGVDVLVNNAGIDHDCPFLQFPADRWQAVIAVNLTGPFLVSQAVARHMAERRSGAIVHVASIDAYGADGNQIAYNASKAGLLGVNRTMAMELAPLGIRSNVVSPGYTATPLTRQYVGDRLYDYMTSSFERVPQGRMATVEEIASAILFLASDDAAGVSGTDLVVDGGTTANLYVVETLPSG